MNKLVLVSVAGCFFVSLLFGAPKADHVDKRLSLDAGVRQTFYKEYELDRHSGGSFAFDYAWKVGGIAKGKSTWISIPMGVTFQTELPDISRDSWILAYGWGITHEMTNGKKVTPILGYGLLLNQLHDDRHESAIFGHQTRFTVGADTKLSDKVVLTYGADYSLTRFPDRDKEKSIKARTVELKVGVRFLRPGTVDIKGSVK